MLRELGLHAFCREPAVNSAEFLRVDRTTSTAVGCKPKRSLHGATVLVAGSMLALDIQLLA